MAEPAPLVAPRAPGLSGALSRSGDRRRADHRSLLGLGAAAVVAMVFLGIGSVHSPSSSASARIAHLEAILKCPSCDNLSIAQSDASIARELDRVVAADVRANMSDQAIEAWVLSNYPGSILVPEGGLGILVFVLPLSAIVIGATGITCVLVARRKRANEQLARADEELVEAALRSGRG